MADDRIPQIGRPNPHCDEPGCMALAYAALRADEWFAAETSPEDSA